PAYLVYRVPVLHPISRPRMPFFFHAPAPPQTYTLSLHDALPIYKRLSCECSRCALVSRRRPQVGSIGPRGLIREGQQAVGFVSRSEEHTSELQSRRDLVCRLLLEKKKKEKRRQHYLIESAVHKGE